MARPIQTAPHRAGRARHARALSDAPKRSTPSNSPSNEAAMLRHFHVSRETLLAMAGLALAWQLASYFFPPYLFPSIAAIATAFAKIFASMPLLLDAAATALRILAGLAGAFVLG